MDRADVSFLVGPIECQMRWVGEAEIFEANKISLDFLKIIAILKRFNNYLIN